MDTNSSVISLQTSLEPRHRRIKALKLDTSAPIKDSALTLVGRVIRVTLDVFKPLEKESIFDFSSGEEQVLTVTAPNVTASFLVSLIVLFASFNPGKQLVLHRPILHKLTAPALGEILQGSIVFHSLSRERRPPYSQRVDRHGRPFRERLPLLNKGAPQKNKLTLDGRPLLKMLMGNALRQ
ncbi:hypothetical protein HID58_075120 [Brassica napus]|uniref:Uncharacterized protein n=1 Tax=Brassica napus TaxID=3708 RepID=A0ABQ7YIR2_BRANA|nr:hypothetical protein HID58_075120 [Brassica napus]